MARNVFWRRVVSDAVSWRQDQALNASMYILRPIGPTGFIIKEEGETEKFKVLIGDPHSCSCPVFRKEKDLCRHICWILLKKYRVPRQNPVTWQLGLVEREINEIIGGIMTRQKANSTQSKSVGNKVPADSGPPALEQREISTDDVCPICQEELLNKHEAVTYCKFGCGNSIHIKCMKMCADHQKSTGDTVIKCPLCRADFGPFELLKKEYINSTKQDTQNRKNADLHLGIMCKNCSVCPISGKCYKCVVCNDYHLCSQCFNIPFHNHHKFNFRQKPTQRWRPAPQTSGSLLPEAVIRDLLTRDISNNDYDLLLQLQSNEDESHSTMPEEALKNYPILRVREGSQLLQAGQQCRVCLRGYQLGQFVRKLPCRHQYHRQCIDEWLVHRRATCPIDGQLVWSPFIEQQQQEAKRQMASQNRNQPMNDKLLQDMIILEIPGVSITQKSLHRTTLKSGIEQGLSRSRRCNSQPSLNRPCKLPCDLFVSGNSYNNSGAISVEPVLVRHRNTDRVSSIVHSNRDGLPPTSMRRKNRQAAISTKPESSVHRRYGSQNNIGAEDQSHVSPAPFHFSVGPSSANTSRNCISSGIVTGLKKHNIRSGPGRKDKTSDSPQSFDMVLSGNAVRRASTTGYL